MDNFSAIFWFSHDPCEFDTNVRMIILHIKTFDSWFVWTVSGIFGWLKALTLRFDHNRPKIVSRDGQTVDPKSLNIIVNLEKFRSRDYPHCAQEKGLAYPYKNSGTQSWKYVD